MSSFRRMVAVPEETFESMQNQSHTQLDHDFFVRMLKISLLLAKINAYNFDLHIRNRQGEYLGETSLPELLLELDSKRSSPVGINEFIILLSEARIPLELIKNEKMRRRLEEIYNSTNTVEPIVDQQQPKEEVNKTTTEEPKVKTEQDNWKYHDFFVPRKRRRKRTDYNKWTKM